MKFNKLLFLLFVCSLISCSEETVESIDSHTEILNSLSENEYIINVKDENGNIIESHRGFWNEERIVTSDPNARVNTINGYYTFRTPAFYYGNTAYA